MIRAETSALLEQSQSSTTSQKRLAPSRWAMMSPGASQRPRGTRRMPGGGNPQRLRKLPRPLIHGVRGHETTELSPSLLPEDEN